MKTLRIGILGLGQIGGGVYSLLKSHRRLLSKDAGIRFEVKKIAVRNPRKKRSVRVPRRLLTTRALDVVRDPNIDVIVELIGGTHDAAKLIAEALRRGKHVVTANKALLAEKGDEIFRLAHKHKRWLLFEAGVGGGIPVMKGLREGLVANHIDSIHAIINGTSNYILSRMSEAHSDFREALKEAQAKGYAEADSTFDIEGVDAAHKLAILARFGFGGKVRFKDIYCEGISSIRSEDIAFAREFGYRIKLLAIAKKTAGGVEARVQPTLLPQSHILAHVNGSFNAVLFRGDAVGDSLFYGQGAGPKPTASAVLSDLADIALRNEGRFDDSHVLMRALRGSLRIKSMSSILSRYYLRFYVVDRPGVLSKISRALGKHKISVSDVIQKERRAGQAVPLIFLTHDAHERDIHNAIRTVNLLKDVRGKAQVIRIEGSS